MHQTEDAYLHPRPLRLAADYKCYLPSLLLLSLIRRVFRINTRMLNCYTARVVPPEHASGVLADIRDGNGKQEHPDRSAATGPTKKTEIVSVSRGDGRGPYDLRQVCL